MNDNNRRRHERNGRVAQFGTDNLVDFKAGTPGGDQFAFVATCYNNAASKQSAYTLKYGESGQEFQVKSDARESLREIMSRVAMAARSMIYAHPGITDVFHMPRNATDVDLLATGRAMYTASAPLEADFIAYDAPGDFRDQLNTKADAFEASFGPATTAMDERVAAYAETVDEISQGARAVRILDGIVRNKYHGNPGKLAAWTSASHVEKAPKPSKPKPPTP